MPFAVLPALVPEITPVYDVYFEAFKGQKMMEFIFPSGVSRQAHKHGTTLWWHQDTVGHTIKCVDSETGDIVGMASWEVYWRPGKENGWKKPPGAIWLKGEDRTKSETVLMPSWNMREKLVGGQKHLSLVAVAVDPKYQKKGVGRLLVKWGIDVAEHLGLPIYLESMLDTQAFFETTGFERLTHVNLIHPALATGEKQDIEVALMVKMPSKANGMSFKEWQDKRFPKW